MHDSSPSPIVPAESTPVSTMRRAGQRSKRYSRMLVATDALAIAWAMFGTQLVRFGSGSAELTTRAQRADLDLQYTQISALIIVVWMVMLAIFNSRDSRIVGTGSVEYKRVVDATLLLFGLVATISYLFQLELARGYILVGLPLGLLAVLASRWCWRQWLTLQRAHGRYESRAVIVGSAASAELLAHTIGSHRGAGFRVVGACILGNAGVTRAPWDSRLPAVDQINSIEGLLTATGADTVIVTSTDELPPARMRELSWSLQPGEHHLVVAPSLVDVGGPRIHMRPVAGLPLLHIETPRFEGFPRFAKRLFDVAASLVLLVLLAPLLIAIAVTIAVSSRGPVLFRQQRVGIGGVPFFMLKFRTMVVDAEDRLSDLDLVQRDAGNTVMFKLTSDPRVTPIGRLLRRYSLDELPQLVNVLTGEMSLVGPRPPLEREVSQYERHVHRRFFVKPGITGLWQVSGRSTLSWDETVRLDLYYVENWSLVQDLIILWRTSRAVVRGAGAF
jgi:exopolysaccharide biosynthesis polyprenyl glycosylphosphotransferase